MTIDPSLPVFDLLPVPYDMSDEIAQDHDRVTEEAINAAIRVLHHSFPTLTPEQLARIYNEVGTVLRHEVGEVTL